MTITITSNAIDPRHQTKVLLRRMLSPFCGLDQSLGFSLRGHNEPRLVVAGAELTGVHILTHAPRPRPGFYHIGGGGVHVEEAMIKSLGETVERYTQTMAEVSGQHSICFASYRGMAEKDEAMLSADKLTLFADDQLLRTGFPFKRWQNDQDLGWIRMDSLTTGRPLWVPAQFVLVGYKPKEEQGEPWLFPAVTTGSAAHTKPEGALPNAVLELIQVDCAMGHWYSGNRGVEIMLDHRTSVLERLIERQFSRSNWEPSFYWLPSADLPSLTIACIMRSKGGSIPRLGVGLGSDLVLVDAMYKALLEAAGVITLAKLVLLDAEVMSRLSDADNERLGDVFNLDDNVAFYSLPANGMQVDKKFGGERMPAASLPSDIRQGCNSELKFLVNSFKETGKDLLFLDLTTCDVSALGFSGLRVWSPELLGICLPSAPPSLHSRFHAYGGFENHGPHPYP